jgi:inner membrane protein
VYRNGHLGVSLLVFAPAAFLLVAAGLPLVALVTGAVLCWLSMLPDLDHRVPGLAHRGPTHSLAFAGLVGVVGAGIGSLVASGGVLAVSLPVPAVPYGFLLGATTVLAHLAADTLTPAGVPYLWPVSGRRYSVSLVRADSTIGNYALLAVGVFATAAATWLGAATPT